MRSKKLKMVFDRLCHLPRGADFVRYGWNKIIHANKKLFKSRTVTHPSAIMIEVTNHCNLHCITCPREYKYGFDMDKGSMDMPLLRKIVDQAYPYVDSIGLTGLGEPLLYKDLAAALRYIKSKNRGIITSISTNASLPDTLGKIEESIADIDSIQISIDGIGDVYNRVRKNGNYGTFLQNVIGIRDIASASDKNLMLNMVVIKENFHQMAEMVELTRELGVSSVNFTLFNLASVTDAAADYYDFFHCAEFVGALKTAIARGRAYPGLQVTFWDYRAENSFEKCHFPWTQFYISWDGYVTPCCAKPFPKELNFGNVRDTPLIECLNSQAFRKFRELWYQNTAPKFCEKCHFIDMKPITAREV
ncbi:MAG: radical SAM protein [Syntrophorhabdaceae bacterium]